MNCTQSGWTRLGSLGRRAQILMNQAKELGNFPLKPQEHKAQVTSSKACLVCFALFLRQKLILHPWLASDL